MIERRWRQRYDSASIALAFDNFERSCRLVELRPFQRRQLGLACAGQTRRNGKVTQGGRTLGEDRLNRSIIRQHVRVAPLAQRSDCVERWIAFAPADRLRIGQHSRHRSQITPYARDSHDGTPRRNESADNRAVDRADHLTDKMRFAGGEAQEIPLARRGGQLTVNMFGPCDNGLGPIDGAVSSLRLNDSKPRVAQTTSVSDVRGVEAFAVLPAGDLRAQKPRLAALIHVRLGHGRVSAFVSGSSSLDAHLASSASPETQAIPALSADYAEIIHTVKAVL